MAAQFLTTSRLNNIINMISLGQQSGILRVVRGQGPTREVGQIKFVEGQPVSALLGQLTGANALTVLSNWGECIYSFDERATDDAAGDSGFGSGPRVPSEPGRYTPSTNNLGGSWPSQGFPNGGPQSQSPFSGPLSGGQPSYATMPGASYQPFNSGNSGYPGQPQQYDTNPDSSAGYATSYPSGNSSLPPSVLMAVPQRTVLAEAVEQLPLDRRERMLLLLVDNRRTLSDLARLTRRSEREVLSVLERLSTLGLVQVNA